ncbi:SDR family oxidoreductase [Pseudonocardia asaccharolytica]|uniref:Short chain dehydrogenase n=1 Tax=Pseudonocardia asaccharolytica DSM 44247 = NBRC 16224 TaxID=1123024 RepID=A0A511CY68_9PSEU|nr:SDR family oxidoreductase [Pseudonocardia asaccharolytica]GEL17510.1 short chain dehydrogenase [Pseudonocardia asaccharolytica DSM 44247 = NBRC 16224]
MSRPLPVATPDGQRLAVYEHGDPAAPTVVAVHGYPDDHTVWDGVVAALRETHHVVTYDVRGAGASATPPTPAGYRLDRLVADLVAVLDAVSPDRPVHLLGHDWGAIQAWHAVTEPRLRARIASYTSISGPCLDHVAHWLRRARRRDRIRQTAASWYIGFFRVPVLAELAWRSGVLGAVLARRAGGPRPSARDGINGLWLYRENIPARLATPEQRRTSVPVQVLAPTADRYVTVPMQTQIEPFVADLRVRRIPGGHWLPRTHPDVVARCVRELAAHAEGGPEAPALRRARAGRGRWADRLVVVTGAGSGIGRATALAFAQRGALVVVADRDRASAQDTAERAGGVAYQVDVSDGPAMAGFAKHVATEHGVPDVVVNNAGIGMAGPFAETTADEWQRIIDVNLWGVIHGCREFGAQLRAHGEGGHLVNVASAAAYLPLPALPAYATTKSAVLTLSQCLRAELAPHGIGVTAVCPGFVHTNITATTRFVGVDEVTERRLQRSATAAYRRRNYRPERVAAHLVRAVERDIALAPVTAEAHIGLVASRLTPGLLRSLARRTVRPDRDGSPRRGQ